MNNKFYLGVSLLFFSLVLVVFMAGSGAATEKEPIKLGIAFDLTGPHSEGGRAERDSALLAIAEHNDAGGIKGRKIEYLLFDEQSSAERATSAAKRFMTEKVNAILCGTTSTTSLAALQVNGQSPQPVPQVGHACAMKLFESPWFFGTYPSNQWSCPSFVKAVASDGHKKVGVLYTTLEWPTDMLERFKKIAPSEGVEVVAIESCEIGSTDLVPQTLKLARAKPDCIVTFTYPIELGAYRRAYQAKGLNIPDYHEMAYIFICWKTMDRHLFDGSYGLSVIDPGNELYEKKHAKFVKMFGYEPPEEFFAMGYDGANMLLEAIKRADNPDDPTSLKKSMETKTGDLETVMGTAGNKCGWTPKDHSMMRLMPHYKVSDGKVLWRK